MARRPITAPDDDRGASDAYERRKERERERQSEQSRAGRDIAPDMPRPKRPAERAKCVKSLRFFCETCMADQFDKNWSDDHLAAIAKMESTILHGETFSLAMPRGTGKSTMVIACVLWAILCGHRRYVALIGADRDAAKKLLDGIKVQLETNDVLLDLFPESCHPVRALEGIANRCRGQLYNGKRTYIKWTGYQVVLATLFVVPPSGGSSTPRGRKPPKGGTTNEKKPTAIGGAIIECCGILGRVRGMHYVAPTGRTLRPDIFVVDDPQTNRSARSSTQVAQRLEIITGTCPGLAGPGEDISGYCTCTVIEEGDVADQLLDRDLWPDWQGERFQLIYDWPTNTDLWDEYATIRAEAAAHGKGMGPATEFYRKHRAAMDAGARVAWPERFLKNELSAIQHAYNLLLKMGDGFWKEYQNAPKTDDECDDLLTVEQIQAKVNGYARGIVPREANLVTAMIDVQDRLLYWLVLAVDTRNFSSWVLDYGTWPKQRSIYFTLRSASNTLTKAHPKAGREGRVRQGLLDLVDHLAGRQWSMPDGVTMLPLRRIGIDAAWGPTTRVVQSVALTSPHRALILPTFGRGIEAEQMPMDMWRPKPGERRGVGWRIRPAEGGGLYGVLDTNYWKNFLHSRLGIATGDAGSLSLHEAELVTTHRMIAEHLRAETRIDDKTGERSVLIWKNTAKQDNHLLDCTAGALAMASIEGAALAELRVARPTSKRRPRRKTTLVT